MRNAKLGEVVVKKLEDQTEFSTTFHGEMVRLVLSNQNKIQLIEHSKLPNWTNNLLNKYFKGKNQEELLEISPSLLLILSQALLGEDSFTDDDQQIEEVENLIDEIEFGEHPVLNQDLEELRELGKKSLLPQTNGEFLALQNSDFQICRCFGVERSEIQSFLKDNNNAGLKGIHKTLRAGVGCGTCINDLKDIIEESEILTKPTSVELILWCEKEFQKQGLENWGEFKSIDQEGNIWVQLKALDEETFLQIVEKYPLSFKIIK